MEGNATLFDVARVAGVSLATASRAINGSARTVGAELREKVLRAAQELDYSPNAAARTMKRGHADVVGMIVPDIADPYFSGIASGVMKAADEQGLMVSIASTRRQSSREAEYVAGFRRQRNRAVILAGSRTSSRAETETLKAEVDRFEAQGGRVAVVSQRKLPVDTVVVENRQGARALATDLTDLGYRDFAVLAGPRDLLSAKDRLDGFRTGLAEAGVELSREQVVNGEFSRDGGFQAMEQVLEELGGIDCVFAVNDVMALGAIAAIRSRGLDVPRHLSVAGFGDISTLRDMAPRLTTVRVDLERLGRLALEMILSSEGGAPRTRREKCQVVLGASTPGRKPVGRRSSARG
ncbi:LacI family DNA-binding transcriptional regulator [Lentzea sp. NEAU-D7]|uniref:LacI family DNA-binding transcriptional regulator n=1 Tax=Lentzea sp. NEAU-D7 TaxID=2994667 RepID=UPI00224AA237|nr:LacI family DNA-binding transcriptional regulator [Lentzea sp. NEAU-D7]MCX2947895.1 LacI family DNA-binding transcriptional regulator [Lentzea sp. NEAU-D7]